MVSLLLLEINHMFIFYILIHLFIFMMSEFIVGLKLVVWPACVYNVCCEPLAVTAPLPPRRVPLGWSINEDEVSGWHLSDKREISVTGESFGRDASLLPYAWPPRHCFCLSCLLMLLSYHVSCFPPPPRLLLLMNDHRGDERVFSNQAIYLPHTPMYPCYGSFGLVTLL